MRIGIFGGSFNPIHVGHIAVAQAALRQCRLDEVWLMVSPQNPLKRDMRLLADELRYAMARKALQGVDGIRASDYELHLPKPSYTWNTLRHLANDHPHHTFTLLIGGDNWANFERWSHWQDILRQHDVVVYPRGEHPGTIHVPLLDVSSTDIRQKVRQGKSIEGLVPDSIIPMVRRHYRSSATPEE